MKKAYCGVALDCTAKYLAGDPNTYAKYLEAVDRIWRGGFKIWKNPRRPIWFASN
ncbi:hypothetical protein Goarm_015473 [Gossypium armourianum]|uniref:Uncharacterized protein n=1 Tax=Gossypium armourianum TaxID=34283 RepID=A0A7J9J9C2_9ROSI|nr:hypothetical protein [Gossypium armourianum]